jgi:hypothetical protein
MYQKTINHAANSATSNVIRIIGLTALFVDISAGLPSKVFASLCNSSAGVTRILNTSNELSVTFSARPRAAGCSESDISHISNTTRTAERPIRVAKTTDASFCEEGLVRRLAAAPFPASRSRLCCGSASFAGLASPHSSGKRRYHASSAARSHVVMKGSEDHSSVPSDADSGTRRVR